MIINEYLSHKVISIFLLFLLSLGVSMLLTPIYTTFAYRHKLWKKRRTTATNGEKLKVISSQSVRDYDVPTMAGVIMVVAVLVVTAIFNLNRQQTWLPLAALVGGGLVGLTDDIINFKGRGGGVAGLKASLKFGLITVVAIAVALFFYYKLGFDSVHLPIFGDVHLGIVIIPLFVLAVISTANAVNISDGLDGLAGGLLIYAYSAFGLIAFIQGNYGIAAFCLTVTGSLLSYVWFNIPPARFFMGDVGSFALGTALGVVAMLTNTVFLLPIIGFVFVIEAGSSLIQILSKKTFHKKVFIAAPIHHHFQALGWPKTKVTMRFWIVGQTSAVIGIILALVGKY
jgi:phospho-N-acetylmuramoyl-pentapeptide-transferase